MTHNAEWSFNDGWILMSVYLTHGENGATLQELIGAADAMNHAIPTTGELSRSLTRLAQGGILSQAGDRLRIAESYLPLIATANQAKGGLFSMPDKGTKWLSQTTFEVIETACITITEEQSSEACEKYLQLLRK
jgi:hypothetical protein